MPKITLFAKEASVARSLANEIPMLPAPRARAMVLLWNPDAELEEYLSVIEGDPALTASVLRAANSAASAPVDRVRSAREAVVRIGFDSVRQISTAMIAQAQFRTLDSTPLDAPELWRHLLSTALLAEAGTTRREERAASFTAGLLHDVGRLALATLNPHRYAEAIQRARRGADLGEAERQLFGVNHCTYGERLAETWELPAEIVDAIARHHDPEATGLAGLVRDARTVTWNIGIGDGVMEPSGPVQTDDAYTVKMLEPLGGVEGLVDRIRWFRQACSGR